MEPDTKRTLKIKTGALKRIAREYESYQREVQRDKARIQKLEEDGASESELKQQQEVLRESLAMIPNTRKRLTDALEDLQNFLEENEQQEEDEDYLEATSSLDSVREKILSSD